MIARNVTSKISFCVLSMFWSWKISNGGILFVFVSELLNYCLIWLFVWIQGESLHSRVCQQRLLSCIITPQCAAHRTYRLSSFVTDYRLLRVAWWLQLRSSCSQRLSAHLVHGHSRPNSYCSIETYILMQLLTVALFSNLVLKRVVRLIKAHLTNLQ